MTQADLEEDCITEAFVRAGGPGGQNVNKVSSAVQLRFDVARSRLPADVKARLRRLAGSRLTLADEILIEASRFRLQERNRDDARERLVGLIARAFDVPKPRKPSRPTRASITRRLDSKSRRSSVKSARRHVRGDDT